MPASAACWPRDAERRGDRPRAGTGGPRRRRRGQRDGDRAADRDGRARAWRTAAGPGGRPRGRGPAAARRGRAALKIALSALVAMLAIAAGAIAGLRWSHFVGADPASGRVAIYQGVPVDLRFGIHLYRRARSHQPPYATLTARQRRSLFDHRLRSEASARRAPTRAAGSAPMMRSASPRSGNWSTWATSACSRQSVSWLCTRPASTRSARPR